MQMEAETLSMLIWGFLIVVALSSGVIIKLWLQSKNKAFIWFEAQIVALCFSFLKFLDLIRKKPEVPETMISEENSLALGITGILWAVSMFCMLRGVWLLGKRNRI